MKRNLFPLFIFSLVFFVSCKKDPAIPVDQTIEVEQPSYFPSPVYTFDNNTFTQDGFELGRMLFYDPVLSLDSTVSCATCHQQFAAFSNFDHPTSHGINSLFGKRNTPALYNLIWKTNFMWDGGVNNLEIQPINPITNPIEMGETLENVLMKLNRQKKYIDKVKLAFGVDSIDSQKLLKSLAQFMGAMSSNNTRYDDYLQGKPDAFNSSELSGLNIFKEKCASCHAEPLLTNNGFVNNGLDSIFSDSGRQKITQLAEDAGKFKIPSLRNIAVTLPYMHDGRFNTLEEVVDHYSNGIVSSTTVDSTLPIGGFQFSVQQKTDLIIFLNTLTDDDFLHDARFSDPAFQ
ncbi:MAG: cytochrome-c peroxidase [Chitinophagales bacterium]|nr:cytochrome-c peroxidase [Chitinophagales bacterium]